VPVDRFVLSACVVSALTGCQSLGSDAPAPVVAVATMSPTNAAPAAGLTPSGRVKFTQLPSGKVLVEATLSGLRPNSEHGFHVHAVPDCSGDGTKTGAHFNPDNHPHNHPSESIRHAGALFNLKTDGNGMGRLRQEANTISLLEGKYNIIGMPLITHRDPDDYTSQPLGNAGPRISCGLIVKE